MRDLNQEKLLELLSAQALEELTDSESAEIRELEKMFPEFKDDLSFEVAASAVSLTNLDTSESLPKHLQAKIIADADKFFALTAEEKSAVETPEFQKTFAFEKPKSSIINWLGWIFAGAACLALAFNLWQTRINPPVERIYVEKPQPSAPTVAQQFEQLLASPETVKIDWSNPKNPGEKVGEVVWNNNAQKGFMRFRSMPVNDVNKETYQLWIIDKTQKNPIDGGVFDVNQAGEIIIPIDAKIKVKEPTTFAVTAEKPGGVVVSAQEKVMAVAKIET